MKKTLYICNRKKCVDCSYPTCYCTTDKTYMEEHPSKELLHRFEIDTLEIKMHEKRSANDKEVL